MALQKTIQDIQRGITATYFRLTSMVIDLTGIPRVQSILSGYATPDVRALPDGAGIALRQYTETGTAALSLMRTSLVGVLVTRGLDLDSLPAPARALIEATSIYDAVAQALYDQARSRPADGKQSTEFADAQNV